MCVCGRGGGWVRLFHSEMMRGTNEYVLQSLLVAMFVHAREDLVAMFAYVARTRLGLRR